MHRLRNGLFHRHVPAEVTDLFFQSLGSQQVTRFCVGFRNPQIDSAPFELPMQRCQKGSPGNINVRRV